MTVYDIYKAGWHGSNSPTLEDYGLRTGVEWGKYAEPMPFKIHVNEMADVLKNNATGGNNNGKHYMSDNQSRYVF